MGTTYLELECVLPSASEEWLLECLDGLEVLGSSLDTLSDGRLHASVFVHPAEHRVVAELVRRLREIGGQVTGPVERPDEDWIAAYREHAAPFPVGEIWWVDPHPDRPTAAPSGRIRLVLEPRRAFGSGTHESTRLALTALERRPPDGRSVLDVGTGSGVLALAARRLGAREVVALDIDPMCVWVARDTARQQEWSVDGVRILAGTLDALAERALFDVVVCNMVADRMSPILVGLAGHLAPDGWAVLSGLLAVERAAIDERLARHALVVRDEIVLGDWIALEAHRG